MLLGPATRFTVILLTTRITRARLICLSAQATRATWAATESLQWFGDGNGRHVTGRASGLQPLLMVHVVGRDFSLAHYRKYNSPARPNKGRSSEAKQLRCQHSKCQGASTFFENGGGQENMIQFVFREADILLWCLIWQETTVPSCKLAKH